MSRKLRMCIVVTSLALFFGAGCRDFVNPFWGDKAVAKVGDQVLYLSEVASVVPSGTAAADSVALLESYVDMWVKKQLKIQEAERIFSASAPDIERMVEEYRSSLLGMKLDNYYVDRSLDTTFTASEIAEYYSANRGDFVLDRDIVKGRVVRLPDNYRQKNRIKELIRWSNPAQHGDLTDICQKNNFGLYEFNAWTDLSDFLALLPASVRTTRPDEVQELRDGDDCYYIYITDRRAKGDPQPLVRVEGVISRILLNRRRAEIVRSYEDSLYRRALNDKMIVINVE